MAAKKPLDVCCEWVQDQKRTIQVLDYGSNNKAVNDAIATQTHKNNVIEQYEAEVNKAVAKDTSENDKANLIGAYGSLAEVSKKKLDCLAVLAEVTSLEELFGTLGTQVDTKSVELSSQYDKSDDQITSEQELEKNRKRSGKDLSVAAQGCIYGLKDNWIWITKLVSCLDTHVKNAAEYHQFFHDADEYENWLYGVYNDLTGANQEENTKGTYQEAQKLLIEIKDILTAYSQWQHRNDTMFERARKVVPVNMRTSTIESPVPVRALCHFKTNEISIREGEELLLLDNMDPQQWRVRNYLDQEATVPALVCLIPPPHGRAVELAIRLRLQLLAAWTNTIKRFGKKLIRFMLIVFRDWSDDEEKTAVGVDGLTLQQKIEILQSIELKDRKDIYRILALIENTLSTNWSDYGGFVLLQEKLLSLKLILEECAEETQQDPSIVSSLVVQIKMLEKLMERYKELWGSWENYKVVVETSKQPELMLICDKWQQLQFVSQAYFNKYWQTNIDVEKDRHRSEVTVEIEEITDELSPTTSAANIFVNQVITVEQPEITETIMTKTITIEEQTDGNKNKVKPKEEEEGWNETTEEITKTTQYETTREWERKGTRIMKDAEEARRPKTGLEWEHKGTKIEHDKPVRDDNWSESSDFMKKTIYETTSESSRSPRTPNGIASSKTVEIRRSPGYQQGSGESTVTVKSTSLSFDDTDYSGDARDRDVSGETKNAHTDEMMHASREEQKKFVIRSVIDPRNKDEISLQQAIMLGIIDPNHGNYVNPSSGDIIPIPVAMSQGLINVEFQTVKRSREKVNTFGLITIKTQKEHPKSYTIKSVLDMKTEKELTMAQAVKRGILNEDDDTFKDTSSGKTMPLHEAIEQGCVAVEYKEYDGPPDYETKTYAVRAAVDQRLKKKIPFSLAVSRGVIDKESGAYINNVTNEKMFVGDAIMRGFLKARLVENPNTLDIDPENQIVVEKVNSIKKKMLQPMRILRAMKGMGMIGSKK